ncbi:MAG: penicillin-binding protein 1C [Rhodothermales bacterium]
MTITKTGFLAQLKRHYKWGLVVLLLFSFSAYCLWPLSGNFFKEHNVTSTRILDAQGTLLREVRPLGSGIPLTAEAMNPFVREAVIAIEDRHFHDHFGVNPVSIIRALQDNAIAGEVVRGGSTLTMQVARTLRGSQPRTLFQKIAEAFLAIKLEVQLSKQQILSLWLNNVYFGNQAYGIEAAAQLYFGKNTIDLNKAEAAFLAGLPQRPNGYNPYKHLDAAVGRQHRVMAALHDTGHLTEKDVSLLKQIPLSITSRHSVFKAPHFVEYIQQTLQIPEEEGVIINTTLNYALQERIEDLATAHLQRLGTDRASNAAVIVLENKTGNILSYVGSENYWNDFTLGQNDGVRMLRQPGSTLKPFTYAIALASHKHTAASTLPDIEIHVPEAGGAFSPLNYDKKFHGPVSLRTALASSYNVPAVRLLREFGPATLINSLHNIGVNSLDRSPDHYGVGLTLGNGEVQLIELAQAYAALARNGNTISANGIQSVVASNGDTLFQPPPVVDQNEINPAVAYLITDILKDPDARSPGFGRYGPLELPFPTAVKTGTSKDYRDNWAVGYTPDYTVAVWVGNFDGRPMRKVSGVSGAGPLFHSIMLQLGGGENFKVPHGIETAMICPLSGKLPGQACTGTKKEVFLQGTVPADTCTVHQQFAIDTRDGLLADDTTPAQHKRLKLFTIYPEEYRNWIEQNGIELPSKSKKSERQKSISQLAPTSSTGQLNLERPSLAISYPKSGMTFQIDPVLHPAYQKIKLQGITQPGLTNTSWLINDESVQGDPQATYWPLKPGLHQIILTAIAPDGQLIKSDPVTIRILPSNEEQAAPPAPAFR